MRKTRHRKKNRVRLAVFGIKYFPSRGGTSRVAENLAIQLAQDYDITMYCYKNPQAADRIPGVQTVEFKELGMGNLGVFLYYLRCCLHIILAGRYDLIHAHKIDSFLFLGLLRWKAPVIATAHEIPYKRDKWGKMARLFLRISEKQYLKHKGIRTSISKPLSDYYEQTLGIPVAFVPNGINLKDKSVQRASDTFWPENLDPDTPFILFAARRIMGTKGLHTMVEALKKMDYKGAVFVAGEMDNFPQYMRKIKHESASLNIHFLGYVYPIEALLDLIRRSKYFVFPSETEGMSIMLLEVASTGVPIIASDIPENTQVFDPSEVVYFETSNAEDLRQKISWAENAGNDLQQYGDNARKKVLEQYSWEKIADSYREIYAQALSNENQ